MIIKFNSNTYKFVNLITKNLSYTFFCIGVLFLVLAIYLQPLVGDDYYIKFQISNIKSFYEFFIIRYFNWTGRFSQILLSYYIYKYEIVYLFFKFFLIFIIIANIYLILNGIIRKKKFSKIDYIIFFILTWFIYPALAETTIWTAGFINYMIPLFLFLFYISFFINYKKYLNNICFYTLALLISFLAGSAHEQLFFSGFIVSSYILFDFYKKKSNFKKLLFIYLFFLLGGLLLIFSPGNFVRLESAQDIEIFSLFFKILLFLFSSLFYLGDSQHSLNFILLIFLIFLIFSKKINFEGFLNHSNLPWLLAYFAALIVVIPAINTLSDRLNFFPIIFFYIYILKTIFSEKSFENKIYKNFKNILSLILCILFLSECFLGMITNYYYNKENYNRSKIIQEAVEKKYKKEIYVSQFSIIPSRLTYIQSPLHDGVHLKNMSNLYKLNINHSNNYPRSLNIRKTIKFFFNE